MTNCRLSIIIPVWNAQDTIGDCLASVCAQAADRTDVEILVVDNGSTDGTAAIIRAYPVTYLDEPVAGSYRARNLAITQARGTYLLFTDADCIPDPDWVTAALQATRSNPGHGLYGGQIEMFPPVDGDRVADRYDRLFAAFDQRGNIARGVCVTANWLSPAAALRQIGMFRADLKSTGDADCARRLLATGFTATYVPGMIVRHPTRKTVRDIVAKRRRVIGGRWQSNGGTYRALPYWCYRLSLEAGGEARRVLASQMDAPSKLRLLVVVGRLWTAAIGELARLVIGGAPRRA